MNPVEDNKEKNEVEKKKDRNQSKKNYILIDYI